MKHWLLFAAVLSVGVAGCAEFMEWLSAPDPITGKTPGEVAGDLPAKILSGDWPGVVLAVAGVAVSGLLAALGYRRLKAAK